ncbi:MAG: hypothetical protein GC131_01490 [Alphaproteobacteria bacterium]|nr:hypothetical protein [Alphaproteobacteria bacterium]
MDTTDTQQNGFDLVIARGDEQSPPVKPVSLVLQKQTELTDLSTAPHMPWEPKDRILNWLFRITQTELPITKADDQAALVWHIAKERLVAASQDDDWKIVQALCCHDHDDFMAAQAELPVTAAEINHFRRNHRGIDTSLASRFKTPAEQLPDPLAALYSLYLNQARADTEATLFIAQASGSTRVARVVADLLAMAGFAGGHKSISYLTAVYSVPAAFDTSALIDLANHEAARRLAVQIDHPTHLLKLSPDDISMLAARIIEQNALNSAAFLQKAQTLAEARQDVNRFQPAQRFRTAVSERDLPIEAQWVQRICAAYGRILTAWVADMPELAMVGGGRRVVSA